LKKGDTICHNGGFTANWLLETRSKKWDLSAEYHSHEHPILWQYSFRIKIFEGKPEKCFLCHIARQKK
jgi:hypothetical protein